MAFIQGSKVRLDVTITDTDTGLPVDPSTLVCRIQDPTGTITDQDLGSGITRLALGSFRAIMDTAPSSKVWCYQWIANDSTETAVRGDVNVRATIPAPTG